MAKDRASGLLVLYDEGKGLKAPEVKLFGPSAQIKSEVSDWVKAQESTTIHRVEWIPSGGLLGASVTYTKGGDPTQSLRIIVPGLEGLEKRILRQRPMESLAVLMITVGVLLGMLGVLLFYLFYPDTWLGGPNQLLNPTTAVKTTVLAVGLGVFLTFAGVGALFRARIV